LFAALGASLVACSTSNDSGVGGGGDATSASGAGGASAACLGGVALTTADGDANGLVACADGAVDRIGGTCFTPPLANACAGSEQNLYCQADADCGLKGGGRCGSQTTADGTECSCAYAACATDDDCDPGFACLCAGTSDHITWPTKCVPAGCKTGADCASGECGLDLYFDGCSWDERLACRTSLDTCRDSSACTEDLASCSLQSGYPGYKCQLQADCQIGRPLLVDGRARTAPATARVDWADLVPSVDPRGLDPATREAARAYWLRIAALEHASVASFSRFSLQLLALGAPPELLDGAHAAARDEIRHASFAYGIASALGGRVGPSRLDVTGALLSTSIDDVVEGLAREACVTETIGAAEALAVIDGCAAGLRAGLTRVAEDESRHAALAWASLRWIVDAFPSAGEHAISAIDAAIEDMQRMNARVDGAGPDIPSLGVLGGDAQRGIRERALVDVVKPLRDALRERVLRAVEVAA
jgi:hypothetical protein